MPSRALDHRRRAGHGRIVAAPRAAPPATLPAMALWTEVGDRVFARRYKFYDQNIGAILGDDGVLDRRHPDLASPGRRDPRRPARAHAAARPSGRQHARPQRPRLRQPPLPAGADLGPRPLRARWSRETGAAQIAAVAGAIRASRRPGRGRPRPAGPDVRRRRRDPRLRRRRARGSSCAISGAATPTTTSWSSCPDADVLFAGDLVENGAPPYFGDGYPIEWPATVERLVDLVTGAVVPGHGDVGDRGFAVRSMVEIRTIAELATLVHEGRPAARRSRRSDAVPGGHGARATGAGGPAAASWTARASRDGRGLALSPQARRGRPTIRTTQRPRAPPARIASSAASSSSSVDLGHAVQRRRVRRPEVRRDPGPQRAPLVDRHVRGVHPEQRDAAQDERQDRRVELRAARIAGRGDRSAGPQRSQDVRQGRRADRVDGAGPARATRAVAALAAVHSSRGTIPAAPSARSRASSSGLPVAAQTSWPRAARIATATLPTPPLAPVTTTGPSPGRSPWRSSAATDIAAVKPAVPIAIARARVSPAGSGTT